jgi:hypothetical protein
MARDRRRTQSGAGSETPNLDGTDRLFDRRPFRGEFARKVDRRNGMA